VSQIFGPLEAGDKGGLGGILCIGCMDTAPSISQYFCAIIIGGFLISLTLLSLFFLSFRLLGGLWISRLHCVYI
jgi:hypothetical protein